jgi:hypothetical protein
VFVVVFETCGRVSAIVVAHDEFVHGLVEIRTDHLVVIHFLGVQEDLVDEFLDNFWRKLLVDYLLSTFVLIPPQPILSQQFEEILMALFDSPELARLEVGHFLATDVNDFLQKLEHALPHLGGVLLGGLQAVDHAVHNVHVLLHSFDALVDAGNFGQFEGFVDNLKVKFQIFAVSDTLDGEGDVLLHLLGVVHVAQQGGEGLDDFIFESCLKIILGGDETPVESQTEFLPLLAVGALEVVVAGERHCRVVLDQSDQILIHG